MSNMACPRHPTSSRQTVTATGMSASRLRGRCLLAFPAMSLPSPDRAGRRTPAPVGWVGERAGNNPGYRLRCLGVPDGAKLPQPRLVPNLGVRPWDAAFSAMARSRRRFEAVRRMPSFNGRKSTPTIPSSRLRATKRRSSSSKLIAFSYLRESSSCARSSAPAVSVLIRSSS